MIMSGAIIYRDVETGLGARLDALWLTVAVTTERLDALWLTVAVTTVPGSLLLAISPLLPLDGVLLFAIPPVLTALTGLFIPLVWKWALRTVIRERAVLAV
jgi:hypothetical protein